MAILQATIQSVSLKRTVPIQVILPVDKMLSGGTSEKKEYPTLYLLHGLLGSSTDWITNTNIVKYATERDLAVVMPSGDNSFYVEQVVPNNDYGAYIGQELVALTRRMFPLSAQREKTFLAGLSMGGFGALRNGFKYAETFGYIAGFSSALNMFELPVDAPKRCIMDEDAVFGGLETAAATDKNPRVAFEDMKHRLKESPGFTMPKIYMAVGTEDPLLEPNRSFRDFLLRGGAELTYREEPGAHTWEFWGKQIRDVMDWLPLGSAADGLNSGNVFAPTR